MKYQYDYELLPLDEGQLQAIEMGLAKIEHINAMILDLVNERAKKGWEPLYPFSVPQIWFRKPATAARKRKAGKKVAKKG